MKMDILLNNGLKMTVEISEFNGENFSNNINEDELKSIRVGETVISKNTLYAMFPTEYYESKIDSVELLLGNGIKLYIPKSEYDASKLSVDLNTRIKFSVNIGNVVLNKTSFMMATPLIEI